MGVSFLKSQKRMRFLGKEFISTRDCYLFCGYGKRPVVFRSDARALTKLTSVLSIVGAKVICRP
jgi:hypothetical protein